MRLSWFTVAHLERRRLARRRAAQTALRVRQLERRRVLDGAAATVVVSAVTSQMTPAAASSTTPATATPGTATTSTTAADTVSKAPVAISVTPASDTTSQLASNADLTQGSALNSPPVLVLPLNQNLNEGQQLNLSGTGGAPPLGLFLDSDLTDTHSGTVNWGDGSATENATVTEVPGVGTGWHSHVHGSGNIYYHGHR